MRKLPIFFFSFFILWSSQSFALEMLPNVDDSAEEVYPTPTLKELINKSSLVAIAQLDDTRYKYIREYPSEGTAWMKPLIIYKKGRPVETFTVFEEGVKGVHCYFPDTDLWQEGNRFLVFLQHKEFIRYTGIKPVCYLPVSVTSENQYALRLPVNNVILPESVLAKAQNYHFTDRGSRIDTTDLLRGEKEKLLKSPELKDEGGSLVYTRGIPISALREYIKSVISEAELAAIKRKAEKRAARH